MPDDKLISRRLVLPKGELKDACVAGFDAVLSYAVGAIEGAHSDPVKAVHEYRKSLRRARSLLRMLRPSLSRRTSRQIDVPLKEAHRSMSSNRDQDVILDTWNRLAASTGLEIPSIGAALERKTAASKFTLGTKTLRNFDNFVDLLAARLDPDLSWNDLGAGLGETYKRARRELARALNVKDPEHLHALRRRVKDLNYQLEAVVSRDDRKKVAATRKQFSGLATDLGVITDLFQLRAAVARLDTPIDTDNLTVANAAINEAIEIKTDACLEVASEALASKRKAWVKSLKL